MIKGLSLALIYFFLIGKDKLRVAKFANLHSVNRAVKHFAGEFPNLKESTIRAWVKTFRDQIKQQSLNVSPSNDSNSVIQISKKRGRPSILPDELDAKLRSFIVHLRTAGGTVNRNVIFGVLMGLIKSDIAKWGAYLDFKISNGWIDYLYQRLNYTRRCATTSRPAITRVIWLEIRHIFLHDIAEAVLQYEIPDELILNVDQTPSKYVSVDKITMAKKGTKHVSKKGCDDKRAITATLTQTLSDLILPFQLIYTGKTKRSLPNAKLLPKGFLLSYNPSHWSNEEETLRLLSEVIDPYIKETKEKLNLPDEQKCLLLWDAFRAQECAAVLSKLEELNIVTVQVPKNLTHLLQPLDLTTNLIFKRLEKMSFSQYFTDTITKALLIDPNRDVASINVDLKLSTLKPLHAKCMSTIYQYLLSPRGQKIISSGWRSSGITEAVENARAGILPELDPFSL